MLDSQAIRDQLEKILNSRALAGSDQLKRLLRVSVERTLDGQTDSTKEYTLGIEAFGRPEGYDPKVDPIVRVQARRLRTKLEEFYTGEGASAPVLIQIPKGGYVPTFEARNVRAPAASRRNWLVAGVVLILAILTASIWAFRSRTVHPLSIVVLPVRNLTDDPGKQYLADKTTEALITQLARSRSLRVVSSTTSRRFANSQDSLPQIARALDVRWVVEGGMGYEHGQVMLKLRAVDAVSDRKVWADFFTSELDNLSASQSKAADEIAASVQRAAATETR